MLWHWACILFCIYCISLLLEERFELAYMPIHRNETFHYLDCLDLRLVSNYSLPETEVDLDQLNRDMVDYFVRLKSRRDAEFGKIYPKNASRFNDPELFNRTFLAPIRSREYLIYRGYVCVTHSMCVCHKFPRSSVSNLNPLSISFPRQTLLFYAEREAFELLPGPDPARLQVLRLQER